MFEGVLAGIMDLVYNWYTFLYMYGLSSPRVYVDFVMLELILFQNIYWGIDIFW